MNPTVFLKSELLENGVMRADVVLQNPPKNFAGVAFDLVIPGQWSLQKTFNGELFKQEDVLVLAEKYLLKPKNMNHSALVFGLSVKSAELKKYQQLKDGVVVSFEIKTGQQKLNFDFKNTVLSVFDGTRRDLKNVFWKSGGFEMDAAKPANDQFLQQQFFSQTQQGFLANQDFRQAAGWDVDGLFQAYFWLGGVAVLMGIVWIFWFLSSKKRS